MRSFVAAMLLFPAVAVGGEFAVDVHGFSKHLNTDEEFNERNPGFGISYGSRSFGVIGGYYLNSIDTRTYYLGSEFMTSGSTVRAGLALGVTYGYLREHREHVQVDFGGETRAMAAYETVSEPGYYPMAAPIIEIGRDYSLRLMFIPAAADNPSVVTATMRFRL